MTEQYKHVRGGEVWFDDNPVGSEPQTELHPTIRPSVEFDYIKLHYLAEAYQLALHRCDESNTIEAYMAVYQTRRDLMAHVTPEVVCLLVEGYDQ